MNGWETPVFYKKRVIGTFPHYSPSLHLFVLKALKPETWGNRSIG